MVEQRRGGGGGDGVSPLLFPFVEMKKRGGERGVGEEAGWLVWSRGTFM
jgi:hypothetical protein